MVLKPLVTDFSYPEGLPILKSLPSKDRLVQLNRIKNKVSMVYFPKGYEIPITFWVVKRAMETTERSTNINRMGKKK